MVALLLGGLTLLVFMSALGMFSRAQITTIKSFGIWFAAFAGLLLAALLFLTGKGPLAITALALVGPKIWQWMAPERAAAGGQANRARPGSSRMTREEALAVLGLSPGASRDDIRAAHLRLMRSAHPDSGGSDWLASRINQARDVLLA